MVRPGIQAPVFFWLKGRVMVRVTTPFDQVDQFPFLVFSMSSDSFHFKTQRASPMSTAGAGVSSVSRVPKRSEAAQEN